MTLISAKLGDLGMRCNKVKATSKEILTFCIQADLQICLRIIIFAWMDLVVHGSNRELFYNLVYRL